MKITKKNLEKQMMASGFLPNMLSGLILMPYIFIYSGVSTNLIPKAMILGLVVMLSVQQLVAPFTNKFITLSVSKRLHIFQNKETDIQDRTLLLSDLLVLPKYIAIQVGLVFYLGCIIWVFLCFALVDFSLAESVFALIAALLGSIISSLFTFNMAENLCSAYAKPIVKKGVDDKTVFSKQFFGSRLKITYVFYNIIPLVFSSLIFFILLWFGYLSKNPLLNAYDEFGSMFRIALLFFLNVLFCIVLNRIYFSHMYKINANMTSAMLSIVSREEQNSDFLDTDLSNELSFNAYLINKIITIFNVLFQNTGAIASSITKSTQDLVIISKQTESISLEQSASVKEIVATMEDSDKLSRNILTRIGDVALVANKTKQNVTHGVKTLATNVEKMREINDANKDTITGIKSLSDKIEGVWDIVNIINTITDQTKIIAFNAELEAASAGEAGKSFNIVATEIRRLADLTTNSTREIKQRITEIQHSSDNLIITSEGGTEKIQEGITLSANLEENFNYIKSSAEITAESSSDIRDIIEQQTFAFEQIVVTLRQIAAGVESFSFSTQAITAASEELKKIAETLETSVLKGN
ncbi:MAG TPA: methyl-accepting chemotaxis protein [Treponemataceae bacterium]|nr:methyl-accepting chemotaxis protein [Treponemataceae bacterium]HOQ92850.1 methyl-accepting chemotaxis protein [Treponemataceae bacterium]HPM05887.1 methyl-accepting chemotaxis protein [Treponemataceae bacterium]